MARPEYPKSYDDCKTVEILAAVHWSEADIARVIGVDAKTLRKHFREELDHGHLRRRAELIVDLWNAAARGSAAAFKNFMEMAAQPAAAEKPEAPAAQPLRAVA